MKFTKHNTLVEEKNPFKPQLPIEDEIKGTVDDTYANAVKVHNEKEEQIKAAMKPAEDARKELEKATVDRRETKPVKTKDMEDMYLAEDVEEEIYYEDPGFESEPISKRDYAINFAQDLGFSDAINLLPLKDEEAFKDVCFEELINVTDIEGLYEVYTNAYAEANTDIGGEGDFIAEKINPEEFEHLAADIEEAVLDLAKYLFENDQRVDYDFDSFVGWLRNKFGDRTDDLVENAWDYFNFLMSMTPEEFYIAHENMFDGDWDDSFIEKHLEGVYYPEEDDYLDEYEFEEDEEFEESCKGKNCKKSIKESKGEFELLVQYAGDDEASSVDYFDSIEEAENYALDMDDIIHYQIYNADGEIVAEDEWEEWEDDDYEEEEYHDWYEEDTDHPLYPLFDEACNQLQVWAEPSTQAGMGIDVFFSTAEEDKDSRVYETDFEDECEFMNNLTSETDLDRINTDSEYREDIIAAIKDYITSHPCLDDEEDEDDYEESYKGKKFKKQLKEAAGKHFDLSKFAETEKYLDAFMKSGYGEQKELDAVKYRNLRDTAYKLVSFLYRLKRSCWDDLEVEREYYKSYKDSAADYAQAPYSGNYHELSHAYDVLKEACSAVNDAYQELSNQEPDENGKYNVSSALRTLCAAYFRGYIRENLQEELKTKTYSIDCYACELEDAIYMSLENFVNPDDVAEAIGDLGDSAWHIKLKDGKCYSCEFGNGHWDMEECTSEEYNQVKEYALEECNEGLKECNLQEEVDPDAKLDREVITDFFNDKIVKKAISSYFDESDKYLYNYFSIVLKEKDFDEDNLDDLFDNLEYYYDYDFNTEEDEYLGDLADPEKGEIEVRFKHLTAPETLDPEEEKDTLVDSLQTFKEEFTTDEDICRIDDELFDKAQNGQLVKKFEDGLDHYYLEPETEKVWLIKLDKDQNIEKIVLF